MGVSMAVLAVLTVVGVGFDQYQTHQTAECQARYNIAFERSLQARSAISDSDRQSLATLVQEVIDAKTRNDSRAALSQYLATKTANDKRRAQNPIPALPTRPHC